MLNLEFNYDKRDGFTSSAHNCSTLAQRRPKVGHKEPMKCIIAIDVISLQLLLKCVESVYIHIGSRSDYLKKFEFCIYIADRRCVDVILPTTNRLKFMTLAQRWHIVCFPTATLPTIYDVGPMLHCYLSIHNLFI